MAYVNIRVSRHLKAELGWAIDKCILINVYRDVIPIFTATKARYVVIS